MLVTVTSNVFQLQMPKDILQRLVVVPVSHRTQFARESQMKVIFLDVLLRGDSLPGDSLTAVGADGGRGRAGG